MAKNPSISITDVENAAAELKHRGKPINPYQIRQFLGAGSYKLIEDYLTSLKLVDDYDGEDPLTKKLIGLVRPLAEALQEEKLQGIEQADARYKKQALEWQSQNEDLKAQLVQRDESRHHLETRLAECKQHNSELKQLESELVRSQEQCSGLNTALEEKQKYVDSLEEKHQHSREALEHFRESVKEQRDKEQRRHEHEIQQLQAAERQADQNLSIRLNEIAQLNRDNARLVAEASESRKRSSEQETKIAHLDQALREKEADDKTKCRDLESATANNQALSEEIALLRDKQETWEAKLQEQSLEISSLKTELEVKNRVFDKLGVG
ncbi:DNA-binding protein [uncultured Methylophaga sp.]|uniref:DNA-binding protein n=1 Tax=uncultured Methylophaga sp. TaxID=285271 RepID=UPI00259CD602|nr:DNA-binding protein [uncultured Methylophaga sp.]|tara:strand:+ start:39528 stop:40499 length:972 start_codon:yes stop_codon:yes gene_type:complete